MTGGDLYVLNGVYKYNEDDYLKVSMNGVSDRNFYIYDVGNKRVGCVSKEFMDENFVTAFEYFRVIRDVDKLFDQYLIGKVCIR